MSVENVRRKPREMFGTQVGDMLEAVGELIEVDLSADKMKVIASQKGFKVKNILIEGGGPKTKVIQLTQEIGGALVRKPLFVFAILDFDDVESLWVWEFQHSDFRENFNDNSGD